MALSSIVLKRNLRLPEAGFLPGKRYSVLHQLHIKVSFRWHTENNNIIIMSAGFPGHPDVCSYQEFLLRVVDLPSKTQLLAMIFIKLMRSSI